MIDLKQQVVVITGGAGLLGQEFIKTVADHNGIAILADIDIQKSQETAKILQHENPSRMIDVIHLDITSANSLQSAIHYLHTTYGKIDALVNNAYPRNKHYGRHFFDVEYDDFCENLNLNLGGYFLASQQLALYFREQGWGKIINISSIYGVIAPKFDIYNNTSMTVPVEYVAIKSALIHLTKYMARYLKGTGIQVNAISPGGIFDHQPESFLHNYQEACLSKGMLDKRDLNGTLLYLLSNMSSFVNGQNIIIDDGFTL